MYHQLLAALLYMSRVLSPQQHTVDIAVCCTSRVGLLGVDGRDLLDGELGLCAARNVCSFSAVGPNCIVDCMVALHGLAVAYRAAVTS